MKGAYSGIGPSWVQLAQQMAGRKEAISVLALMRYEKRKYDKKVAMEDLLISIISISC